MSNLLKLEKQRATIEARINSERSRLLALPRKAGFASINDLVAALLPLTTGGSGSTASAEPAPKAAGRRGRKAAKGSGAGGAVRYSPEIRDSVKSALESGRTAKSISEEFGPSIPLINVWKKGWGLTKSRKKSRGKKK